MKIVDAALFAVTLAAPVVLPTTTVSAQTSCQRLSSISLLNATVTLATSVPAGNVSLPEGGRDQALASYLGSAAWLLTRRRTVSRGQPTECRSLSDVEGRRRARDAPFGRGAARRFLARGRCIVFSRGP
jgi:hypothetical protein